MTGLIAILVFATVAGASTTVTYPVTIRTQTDVCSPPCTETETWVTNNFVTADYSSAFAALAFLFASVFITFARYIAEARAAIREAEEAA